MKVGHRLPGDQARRSVRAFDHQPRYQLLGVLTVEAHGEIGEASDRPSSGARTWCPVIRLSNSTGDSMTHSAVPAELSRLNGLMRALRMVGFQREPELVEIPEPVPGPGEVVIKVGAAGACHSDLHILYELDASAVWRLPMTLGHETAGWVHALGPGVADLNEGDAVAVYGAWGCRVCPRCAVGLENYCERPSAVGGGGLGLDGGMADYLLVPTSATWFHCPPVWPRRQPAPLTDAGLTLSRDPPLLGQAQSGRHHRADRSRRPGTRRGPDRPCHQCGAGHRRRPQDDALTWPRASALTHGALRSRRRSADP